MLKNFKRSLRFLFRNNLEERIKELESRIINVPYELVDQDIKVPQIETIEETIEKMKKGYSITRFGDGEFNLMLGGRIHFQDANQELAEDLKSVISSSVQNLLIGLPPVFQGLEDCTEETRNYFRMFLKEKRLKIYSFLSFEKRYSNAFCSRLMSNVTLEKDRAEKLFNSLRDIWNEKEVLLVSGEEELFKFDIYDNAKTVNKLKVPSINAYENYSKILNECEQSGKNKVVVLSVGPTATVLAHDLSKKGFHVLDLGHLNKSYNLFMNNEKYQGGW